MTLHAKHLCDVCGQKGPAGTRRPVITGRVSTGVPRPTHSVPRETWAWAWMCDQCETDYKESKAS